MFKRIMVPIETKEKSENAIKIAYELAIVHNSEIILFNVIKTKSLNAVEEISDLEREEQRKELEEDRYKMLYSIKKTAPNNMMKVFIDIVEGEPASRITEEAKKNKVDLIVMPKTGKIGPRRVLVGDISVKVVECTDIPVMMVA
ncbi:MAG: universal stress protein [Deltaproteobacteria bacterium]|uniref:Universal stress protein n=1 Tax=Candidatus Zymogenus saltonus TaxID=2844893 RepID=A0A9D8KA80_9DELT|nr:universal stress protein [Candidatus Zymogenus saltonus]